MPTPATVLKPRGNVATRPKKPPSSFAKLGVPLAILGFISLYGGFAFSGALHTSPVHTDGEELGGDDPLPLMHDSDGEALTVTDEEVQKILHESAHQEQQQQQQQQQPQPQPKAAANATLSADGKCDAHAPVVGTLAMGFRGQQHVELRVSEDVHLYSSEFSVALWVRLPAKEPEVASIQTLLASKASGCEVGTEHRGFALFANAWKTDSGQLFFSWGNGKSGCEELATAQHALVPGRWAFVAATLDEHKDVSLYVDGVKMASTADASLGERRIKSTKSPIDLATPSHNRLKLGLHEDGTHAFRGHMAAVTVWPKALSAAELEKVRCGQQKGLQPPPLLVLAPSLTSPPPPSKGAGRAGGGGGGGGGGGSILFASVREVAGGGGDEPRGTVREGDGAEPAAAIRVAPPSDAPSDAARPFVSTLEKLSPVTEKEVEAANSKRSSSKRGSSSRGRATSSKEGGGGGGGDWFGGGSKKTNVGDLPNGWPISWLPGKTFPKIDAATINASDAIAYGRREQVRGVMKRAWSAYKKYAWGADELKPVSNRSHDWLRLGATMVDCLDNLWIMDMKEEFWEAREWVATRLSFGTQKGISMFETIIRILGGLLSAFELSRDRMFLSKAQELADKMMFSFDRNKATGLPCTTIALGSGSCSYAAWTGQAAVLAEFGTIQLEFKYLSVQTGERKYWDAVERIMQHLRTVDKPHGLYPVFMSPSTGRWTSQKITLGALGDSFYEYLVKQWLITNKKVPYLREMFDAAALNIAKLLVQRSSPSGFVYIADWSGSALTHKMDHLACFAAGMYAVGAQDNGPYDAEYMTLAEALAETCYKMYANTVTGLSPEFVQFAPGRDLVTPRSACYNIGRPEAVEAWYYMYQYTKDPKWREMGWKVFEAFEKHAATKSGWTALPDVDNPKRHDDKMESFVLAETVKYFYLLFDPDDKVPLDKYVFNTEAHPLGRFDPLPAQ